MIQINDLVELLPNLIYYLQEEKEKKENPEVSPQFRTYIVSP
jgi:hypothetical protein